MVVCFLSVTCSILSDRHNNSIELNRLCYNHRLEIKSTIMSFHICATSFWESHFNFSYFCCCRCCGYFLTAVVLGTHKIIPIALAIILYFCNYNFIAQLLSSVIMEFNNCNLKRFVSHLESKVDKSSNIFLFLMGPFFMCFVLTISVIKVYNFSITIWLLLTVHNTIFKGKICVYIGTVPFFSLSI